MKTRNLWRAAVVAVVAGSTLVAGMTLAEGGKIRQQNGKGYGTASRTGIASGVVVQKGDRARNRARDGSCQATASQTRDRARDGSCQTR